MDVKKIQDFKLNDITLIASLPDMGSVGGLVSKHISKKLDAKLSSKIIISDKPWINQKEGIIELPKDEYSILVDKKNSIVIITGNYQPQEPNTVLELTEKVINEVKKIGNIKKIISSGGYLIQNSENADKVFGVATDDKTKKTLQNMDVKILGSDVPSITWFNGLILGKAKSLGIDGFGLFGEILDSNTPQYRAAINIIKIIEKIIKVNIDTSELEVNVDDNQEEKPSHSPGIG